MEKKNQVGNLLSMQVTEGLTVMILPNSNYEFLMTTKNVAHGYGVTEYAIRQNKVSLSSELIEGKHFVLAVSIPHGELPSALKTAHNAVLWTKRGVVRLGFAMRAERAKLFRDWAEELVIDAIETRQCLVSTKTNALPAKRKHNRLTTDRLLSIMADVTRIDDRELRLSIASKLMQGGIN